MPLKNLVCCYIRNIYHEDNVCRILMIYKKVRSIFIWSELFYMERTFLLIFLDFLNKKTPVIDEIKYKENAK